MRGLLEEAKQDKSVAMAIIWQEIIDEGYIGAYGTVADAWGLIHSLRTKIYRIQC